ncbi:hypothetical protein [Paenibacillus taihuensis]|uniref:hypothetical protein n=1 Tax=Paenibacillus taihuensis TaxID=1156355 RepID=UPI000E25B99C|nr:hypothetical protein [Paenibacillus taihuensis]
MGGVLYARIVEYFSNQSLNDVFKHNFHIILSIWANYGDADSAKTYVQEKIQQNPHLVIKYLLGFLGLAQSADGVIRKAELEEREYSNATRFCDPEIIYNALKETFGDHIDVTEYPYDRDMPTELSTAQQFCWIYKRFQEQESV